MNIADPKYLEHLRDLPSGYLLDMLADHEGADTESLYWVLQERGLSRDDIDQKVQRRRSSGWPRPYKLWAAARWLTLFNALIVSYFNLTGLYRLVQSEHAFKVPLLFLAVGCIICGFVVGFKLTTHIYQGSPSRLYCGFPFQVGSVELQSGQELPRNKALMTLHMALNALVGVSLTLFPLIFIFIMMD
jgi:hypothetical protein